MASMEKVTIVWSGPYSIESAIRKLDREKDFGVYMIIREWKGKKTLLYIGSVYGDKYWRSFADRIAEHKREWLYDLRGIRIYVGRVKLQKGKRHSKKRIEDIECLLIYVHQPEENVRCMSSYTGRELKIINVGRRGPLFREIYTSEDYIEYY